MKSLTLLLIAAPLFAGNLDIFTDNSLNYTQRNTACMAMRGDNSEEALAAMRAALTNISLQACAAVNLRTAGAHALLAEALGGADPGMRCHRRAHPYCCNRPDPRSNKESM